MKSQREIREEKYPKLFNHLKTMQGITEEQREICLNDFYEMCEKSCNMVDSTDVRQSFLWRCSVSGFDFWKCIHLIQEINKKKEND